MDDENLIERTRRTAKSLFEGPVQVEVPYQLWKEFDPGLAKDLSLFVTGKLYSRDVLPLPERQVVAVAALAALQKSDELKIHLHGALNVGVPAVKLAEAVFQVGIYAGFPAVNAALAALKEVLKSRREWPIQSLGTGSAGKDSEVPGLNPWATKYHRAIWSIETVLMSD